MTTLVDALGRTVTVSGDTYSVAGVASVTNPDRASALATLSAMGPSVTPGPQLIGLSYQQFLALFAPAEQDAIISSGDAQVKLFVTLACGADGIDLTSPTVVNGVGYLASLGLITSARAATILSGVGPS